MGDENGKPTDQLIKKYEALAKGEVGGIITGFIGVGQQGKASDKLNIFVSYMSTKINKE